VALIGKQIDIFIRANGLPCLRRWAKDNSYVNFYELCFCCRHKAC